MANAHDKKRIKKMNQQATLASGAFAAALAVGVGAFGAHALKETLQASGNTLIFEVAVRYQFYHAFALLFNGLFMQIFKSRRLRVASWLFVLGIIFFSGSLYVLSLSGVRVMGAVTPVGGVLFILGWIFMLLGILKK